MENQSDQPPFPRHKRYYLALKFAVLAIAALAAANLLGFI